MERTRIIAVAAFLAIVGAAAPIGAMLAISWNFAVADERERLALIADQVVTRATLAYERAVEVLYTIENSGPADCSEAHIARMRTLTLNTLSIEEIGAFENGLLTCTSWGRTEGHIPQTLANYRTKEGIDVTVWMLPQVTRGEPMMALQYKSHNVLVNPARFVDVIVDPAIRVAIANDRAQFVSTMNAPDRELARTLAMNHADRPNTDMLYAVAHRDGLIGIAMESPDEILDNLRRLQLLLLPIGAFIAAITVGVVIWLSRRRLSPRGELTIAVRKREFIVHYQPIIEVETGLCIGAEALVRWRRPGGAMVAPDLFIPLAEATGLIMPITDLIVETVMTEMGAALAMDRSLHVSINVCAADIKTGRILSVIQAALHKVDIRPQQIWLEATERGFMDIDAAQGTLAKARAQGYRVAIDDFGTGYSSLQYLQSLVVDTLKVDKSFVETIGLDTATSSVIAHIISMARALNLLVVAEGVETQAQADYLAANKVRFVQGWLYSKALPAKDFLAFHHHNRAAFAGVSETPRAAE